MHGLSVKASGDADDLDRLARRAADGDGAAFEALVRRTYRRIYRWARVRLGDDDDAEDVTQRVLITLHEALPAWEGRARFTSWLYRVTANEASSFRRRAARHRKLRKERSAERAGSFAGPEDLDRKRLARMALACFEELPPRQREIMDLVDFQGFAPGEVAEMLEMNSNTVRANLFKARRSLRTKLLERRPDAGEAAG